MKIKSLNALQPFEYQSDSIIIEDDDGTPVVAAASVADAVVCGYAGTPEFEYVLRLFGIQKPEVVDVEVDGL